MSEKTKTDSSITFGWGRSGGKTMIMLAAIKEKLKDRSPCILPCFSKHHARRLKDTLSANNFNFRICAGINLGVQRLPHRSRRSIYIEVRR